MYLFKGPEHACFHGLAEESTLPISPSLSKVTVLLKEWISCTLYGLRWPFYDECSPSDDLLP